MKGRIHLNFDIIFHSCPKGLKKMVIVMDLEEQLDMYTPIRDTLMTGKFDIT